MGSKFDPHNYRGNKNLVDLIKKMQLDKTTPAPSSVSANSEDDSPDNISPPTPLNALASSANSAKINDELNDEFYSSVASMPLASVSIHSDIQTYVAPIYSKKNLEIIKQSNPILDSLRNLPSIMARTFIKKT